MTAADKDSDRNAQHIFAPMPSLQPIKFRSLDDFFCQLQGNEQAIVQDLRDIVLNSIPNVREKLSYNVPYYYRHQRICFIWPASVPWGNVKQNGVLFGFCQGHLLTDELAYLDRGNRKQVYTKTYTMPDEIDRTLLQAYLAEALEVDESLHQPK